MKHMQNTKEIQLSEIEKRMIEAYREIDKTGKSCVLRMLGLDKESNLMYYGEKVIPFLQKQGGAYGSKRNIQCTKIL